MEEEISKDASDTRAEKAKERQDHYIAQQIQQEDERERDPRNNDEHEPKKVDEDMTGDHADDVVDVEGLIDAPASNTYIRLKSPERRKAKKRGTARHEEEPSTQRI